MQRIMGLMRKAITQYDMIQPGDHIAVGVSGGKDSMAMLAGLCRLREYIGIDFSLTAITLDPCFGGVQTDYSPVAELCDRYQVPYLLRRTDIGAIVFDIRQEPNPCSLCARMRRGALHDAAKAAGCNKVALGHNYDDAVETFMMNLFNEGRVGCFSPVTYLSRKDLTMIRPLLLAEEAEIRHAVRSENLPIVKSKCPADGNTDRERTKRWLRELEVQHKNLRHKIFGAMQRAHISGF